MLDITLGDVIGYGLAILLSLTAGIVIDHFILIKITQTNKAIQKNNKAGRDFIGRDKIGK